MQAHWPLWRRLLFRFFFVYFAITMSPWTWLDNVPYIGEVTKYWYQATDWLVRRSNDWFFHVKPQLIPISGSGDTSFGWAQLWFVLSISFIGMLTWSFLQHRKQEYTKLNYWLCLFIRYYVALVAFSYGIIKLFALQMPFPSYSQLATPLGDFLPMRLSWMFIGYSTPYQFFSGVMETLAGLLLIYRRTATLGVLLATAVFLNVAVLNLSYDIPVKIFSIQMVVCCLFLLANESDRILCFFIYNRPASVCELYHYGFPKRWMKITRIVLKLAFVVVAIGLVIWQCLDFQKERKTQMKNMPFAAGLYDVAEYVVNQDTLPASTADSLRWKNIVFDNNRGGSIGATDTLFNRRYHRSYFQYKADTVKHTLGLFKGMPGNEPLVTLQYRVDNDNSIFFWGVRKTDSISFRLRKNPHHYQLAERQFHWLSEANR
jgi:hypothetical protein